MVMATDNGKVHTIAVGNTRSNWAGYGLDTLDWPTDMQKCRMQKPETWQ